ncbi:MAG: TIGR02300 family protein [Alphaproteobacteria bacterium]|nr:TIGR02300 family protein [Alphaproteobacteria bacterium]
MSAVADARGLKRVCVGCGSRFYDLNKRPIVCPGCSTEFKGEVKTKARRGRLAEADAPVKEKASTSPANDQFEEIEATEDTVSLEEVEEGGDDADDEEALGMEDGDIEDVEVLEDEDLEVDVGKKD